ncbi:aldo/keto reductase [Endozoicomonas montiporae]|uniref:Aldo/keto reductase n=2 Tax=Endozoicomonas montiporae TaxID=1027273 RepID=A0A081N473_9GAMM|nr:aldo/keto reductase [Endozoicomonas montiporae]AMO57915.1 aldo/keto reductase family oxidoreductase [Endozoicomonas montiporae CL-33]KEQ13246.1 aldo/keto reductase [Endozoicomonas montiporae]
MTDPVLSPRRIAGTDIAVSPIGFGTVKLGRDQQVKYPQGFKIPDDRTATELLKLARSLGINLLDTAPAYGISEERLGRLLQGQRQDWVICSKVGEEFSKGQSHFDFSPEHVRFSIERSLKRLKTDYIDMVLVHSSGDDVNIIQQYGCLDVLADLKKEGLIRATGMSTKTVEGGILALEQSDIAMVTYNLNEQAEKPVLDYAEAHDKGILIKKALASGHVCLEGEDPVEKSMELVLGHPAVSSAIIGTINPKHLRDNVKACARVLE